MKKPIIVITGPTASGKTAVSLDVVPKFNGAVIAADSTTVYEGMDIGTDKPDLTKTNIKHYLIDILKPDQEYNLSIFQEKATEAVTKIETEGQIPFLVGGATMYLDAFVYSFSVPEVKPDPVLRAKLEQKTNEELFAELVSQDPQATKFIDAGNTRRLIRALEVIKKTGKPFSEQRIKNKLRENVLYLAVKKDREELYAKINERVDEMFQAGFVAEVKGLYEKYGKIRSLETAGYRQVIQHLEGEITLAEAIEKTKQAHRNYAKRQLTWLSGNPDVIWIKDAREAEEKIINFLD